MAKRTFNSFKTKLSIKAPQITLKELHVGKNKKKMRNAIARGIEQGAQNAQVTLRAALNKSMSKVVWGPFNPKYDYISAGGNLRTAGTLRSLIDTGALKDTLMFKSKVQPTRATVQIIYTSPYAKITHYGGLIRPYGNQFARPVVLPARPWVSATLRGGYPGVDQYNWRWPFRKAIKTSWNQTFK